MISEKLSKIYYDWKIKGAPVSKIVKDILEICEFMNYEDVSIEESSLILEKSLVYLSEIGAGSNKMFKFLESLIVGNTSLTVKRYIYNILDKNYEDKRLRSIREFLLQNVEGFFPNEFDGIDIINAGLTEFTFKCYKTLTDYFPTKQYQFYFNPQYQGYTNNIIYITTKNHNTIYPDSLYNFKTSYEMKEIWEFDKKDGHSCYLIEGKYKIELILLNFCIHIFTALVNEFSEDKMILNFSNDEEIPSKLGYEGSNIIILIFNRDLELQAEVNEND